jgi:hypothetical protein
MTPREMRLHWVGIGYDRGWSFTPLNGKRPRLLGWPTLPRETRDEALAWAAAGNIGVRCGAVSYSLVVIDVDCAKGATWECPVQTISVRTGGGGRHHYFAIPGGVHVPNSSGKIAPFVDVKAEHGQVVYPGSVHPQTGKVYDWLPGCGPHEVLLRFLPRDIFRLLTDPVREIAPPRPIAPAGSVTAPSRYAAVALERERDRLATTGPGGRGTVLFAAAASMGELVGAGLLDAGTVRSALLWACDTNGLLRDDGAGAVERELERGLSVGIAHPRSVTA